MAEKLVKLKVQWEVAFNYHPGSIDVPGVNGGWMVGGSNSVKIAAPSGDSSPFGYLLTTATGYPKLNTGRTSGYSDDRYIVFYLLADIVNPPNNQNFPITLYSQPWKQGSFRPFALTNWGNFASGAGIYFGYVPQYNAKTKSIEFFYDKKDSEWSKAYGSTSLEVVITKSHPKVSKFKKSYLDTLAPDVAELLKNIPETGNVLVDKRMHPHYRVRYTPADGVERLRALANPIPFGTGGGTGASRFDFIDPAYNLWPNDGP